MTRRFTVALIHHDGEEAFLLDRSSLFDRVDRFEIIPFEDEKFHGSFGISQYTLCDGGTVLYFELTGKWNACGDTPSLFDHFHDRLIRIHRVSIGMGEEKLPFNFAGNTGQFVGLGYVTLTQHISGIILTLGLNGEDDLVVGDGDRKLSFEKSLDLGFDQQNTGITTVGNDQSAGTVAVGVEVVVADEPLFGGDNLTLLFPRRCGSSGVEGPQGQLGSRLPDRLGSDNPYCFAFLDEAVLGHVEAVAFGTDPFGCLAGSRGTHDDRTDTRIADDFGRFFINQRPFTQQHFIGHRVNHILSHNAAIHAIGQRLNQLITDADLGDFDPFVGTTVFHAYFDVLGDINELTGQVTGVGGLEGGIGQTFPRSVGGDEVLQHIEPFTEVGRNRRLNDRSV